MDNNVAMMILGKLLYYHCVHMNTMIDSLTSIYYSWSVYCSALYTGISPPNAGTLLIYEPVVVDIPRMNMQLTHDDKTFYEDCCSENMDVSECQRFYRRRARMNMEMYSPPVCCGES